MMEKKYKLTDETTYHHGKLLHRIEALRDFSTIKQGEKGGFVESEYNLSQEGNCWIYDNAKVFDNARVYDNASVCGEACISDNSIIRDHANVSGYACISCKSRIYGKVFIQDHVIIANSHVFGYVEIGGRATIQNADISRMDDYIVFKNWWSSGRYFTWTRCNNMWSVGCFYGTGEELIAKAYKESELSGREYERVVRYVEAINQPIKPARSLNRIQRIVCKLFKIK